MSDPPILDPTPENVRRAAQRVRAGELVVVPSDTNALVVADPTNPEALSRVYEAKGRSPEKPLASVVHDPGDWRRYGRLADESIVEQVVDAFWPGPLIVVLEARETVPDPRLEHDGTVALTCLSHPTCRAVTAHLSGPVAATSANRSGTVPDDRLIDPATARDHLGDHVACVLDGEDPDATRATTILSLVDREILRQGDVSPTTINERVGHELVASDGSAVRDAE